ncbi:MAG: hypothetical protein WKF47_03315 [Geodermatophilaceae bacterium]
MSEETGSDPVIRSAGSIVVRVARGWEVDVTAANSRWARLLGRDPAYRCRQARRSR